jgi:microcystin degradation protein MlrC
VTGDGDDPRWRGIAEAMMDEIWRRRDERTVEYLSVAEAVAAASKPDADGRPLVIADATDNPGGGGYGDATNLLAGMIAAGIENAAFAPVSDGEAVRACAAAGLGARVRLAIGGKIDPAFGPPLEVEGRVRHLGDGDFVCDGPMWQGLRMSMGPTAVLGVGGIDIVLATNRFQITDLQHFLSVGIDPRRKTVVAVKSSQHFRAAYAPIARAVLVVDAGGLTSPDLARFPYRKLRRPIWPLDPL